MTTIIPIPFEERDQILLPACESVQKAKELLTGSGKTLLEKHYEETVLKAEGLFDFLIRLFNYHCGFDGSRELAEKDRQIKLITQKFNDAASEVIKASYENVRIQNPGKDPDILKDNRARKKRHQEAIDNFKRVFKTRVKALIPNDSEIDNETRIKAISNLFFAAIQALADEAESTSFKNQIDGRKYHLPKNNFKSSIESFKTRFYTSSVQDFRSLEIKDQQDCFEQKSGELFALFPEKSIEQIEGDLQRTLTFNKIVI